MHRRTLYIGLMLFSLFFGAGNLVFPPELGQLSGEHFVPALIGFLITAVGLPLLSIVGSAFSSEGYARDASRVHPLFSRLFFITICLALGPVVATPRTGTVAYEMGALPFIQGSAHAGLWMVSFLMLFFGLVLWLSLTPGKLVERIGKILTPALLLALALFAARALGVLDEPIIEAGDDSYAKSPFFEGFSQGYQTMDTIAAIVFSFIVLEAIKHSGFTTQRAILGQSVIAAVMAAVGIGVVYSLLAWIGNYYELSDEAIEGGNIGVNVLNGAARLTYGEPGRLLLSIIVGLACLTTAVGLTASISGYLHKTIPRVKYSTFVTVFTLISFGLATRGLDSIIRIAGPILDIVYPVTIVLILLVYVDKLLRAMPNIALQLPIYGTLVISLLSVLAVELEALGLEVAPLSWVLSLLPLHASHMEWIVPAIALWSVGLIVGYAGHMKTA